MSPTDHHDDHGDKAFIEAHTTLIIGCESGRPSLWPQSYDAATTLTAPPPLAALRATAGTPAPGPPPPARPRRGGGCGCRLPRATARPRRGGCGPSTHRRTLGPATVVDHNSEGQQSPRPPETTGERGAERLPEDEGISHTPSAINTGLDYAGRTRDLDTQCGQALMRTRLGSRGSQRAWFS